MILDLLGDLVMLAFQLGEIGFAAAFQVNLTVRRTYLVQHLGQIADPRRSREQQFANIAFAFGDLFSTRFDGFIIKTQQLLVFLLRQPPQRITQQPVGHPLPACIHQIA